MVADCQELVGYVLARVKTTVEEKLGFHVESCVVSVSSTFHQTQRLALLAACKDEGFFNVRFLSDCLCAAIAFDVLFKKLLHPRNVLIFDFGSYKCESSVVTVGGKSYQVKSMSGLDSVGGVDVDNLIAKRFEQNFLQQNKKKKLRDSTKLKYFAERAKQNLSTSFNTKVEIDDVCCRPTGGDVVTSLSRDEFDQIVRPLLVSTMFVIENCLQEASVEKSEIDYVVLVGGCSKIPLLQSLI